MSYLIAVLSVKIIVTLIVVVYPTFLRPVEALNKSFGTDLTDPYLFRIYGVAISALLVAYAYGIFLAQSGVFPWGIVLMGLVSNGGASAVMLVLAGWEKQRAGILLFGGIFCALLVAVVLELIT